MNEPLIFEPKATHRKTDIANERLAAMAKTLFDKLDGLRCSSRRCFFYSYESRVDALGYDDGECTCLDGRYEYGQRAVRIFFLSMQRFKYPPVYVPIGAKEGDEVIK